MDASDIATPAPRLGITDDAFIKCPFHDYKWMRDENPVYVDETTGFYVVTRYDHVRQIATNPTDWSSKAAQIINRKSDIAEEIGGLFAEHGWMPMDTLVTNDPPDHGRYRALVDRAFSPARVKTIQPLIDRTVTTLIDNIVGRGEIDFVNCFAMPLTMTIIADQLGVDAADMTDFRRWTDCLMEGIDPRLTPERERAISLEVIALQNYLAHAIERFRLERAPTILSDLVHADVNGEHLTVQEVIAVATLLLGAGNDTTTSTLASAVRHLAENPKTFRALAEDPSKVANFVEEALRLYAPTQRLFRRARRDLEIEGVAIPEGATVVIQWGGANRDERRFKNADELDLDRVDASKHLSFGAGIHFCIGNQLARAELRTAIAALTSRSGRLKLANGTDSYDYHAQIINLSPSRLDVIFDPLPG